jgi:hypothetical protein
MACDKISCAWPMIRPCQHPRDIMLEMAKFDNAAIGIT